MPLLATDFLVGVLAFDSTRVADFLAAGTLACALSFLGEEGDLAGVISNPLAICHFIVGKLPKNGKTYLALALKLEYQREDRKYKPPFYKNPHPFSVNSTPKKLREWLAK